MDNDKVDLIFGVLLHDVGKIIYRGISEQGTHSKLGADFIKSEIIGVGNNDTFNQAIVDQIRYHHARELKSAQLPTDSLAYITYFADNISARMDRKEEGFDEGFDRSVKLHKIFNILNDHHDVNTLEHMDYNAVREKLRDRLIGIKVSAYDANSLLNLLEATTDSIPSSTNLNELIDVSLFDHAKTTAGIASCIYDYLKEKKVNDYKTALFDANTSQEYYEKNMFLLYSCDMSGIQSFIYNISGTKALKQLRARSFYLEIMLEHIADELLTRLGLTRCNLLYTGGGHSYLLLPNTQNVKDALSQFEIELKQWLLDNFKTDLYVAQAFIECSADDLANSGDNKKCYRNLYRELSRSLSESKSNRYSAGEILALNTAKVDYDHTRECKECHRSDLMLNNDDTCPLCASLADISRDLIKADIFTVSSDSVANKHYLTLPFDRILNVYSEQEYLHTQPSVIRIYDKNDWHTGINLSTHIWMGDYQAPTEEGISEYAKNGATLTEAKDGKRLGIKRLGVLRADVDNLGAIFTSGLPDEKISISRTTTLSRQLSYFFKFKINEILESKGYKAQIIYSGGDDLFIIGNWSDIIYVALDIRNELNDFTGNQTLTISAGIGMFSPTYPIAKMAAEVANLEDAAKSYKLDENNELPDKNAVALWTTDKVYSWKELEENILGEKLAYITNAFEHNDKGKSFIYRLLGLLRDAKENEKQQISTARLVYLLVRSFEDKDNGDEYTQRLYAWAIDSKERQNLATALELYVYSIRERG